MNQVKLFLKDNLIISLFIGLVIFLVIYAIFRLSTNAKGSYTPWSYYPYLSTLSPSKKKTGRFNSKSESKLREILENYFLRPFPNVRPDFLRNPTEKVNLELDCYNDDLKLAIEYNGQQHYKYTPYFHPTPEAFKLQKYRDEIKRRLCKEAGVTLIEIPYTVKYENLEFYLMNELKKAGF